MPALQTSQLGLQRLVLTIAIAVFVVFVFGISFQSMWDLWQTTDHRHGLLVFPISLFLIWQVRHQLDDLPLTADVRGLALVVLLASLWLVVRLAGIQVVEHAIVLALIPAAVITLVGQKIAGKIMFPLFFLLFATPIGESLVPYLMVVTADLSAGLLTLSGVPLLRNGQYMSLPGGEFVVADVCSGLHYLLTGSMIALLFGYLTYTSFGKRLLFFVVTAVTLVIANGVRAYIVIAVASATDMRYLAGRDHVYFGWLMFGLVIMLVMWVGGRFADERMSTSVDPSQVPEQGGASTVSLIAALGLVMLAMTMMPLMADFGKAGVMLAAAGATVLLGFALFRARRAGRSTSMEPVRPNTLPLSFNIGYAMTAIAMLIVLVTTPRFAALVEKNASNEVGDVDFGLITACTSAGPWGRTWQPEFDEPDLKRSAMLTCKGESVNVYVGVYASALQGSELVSSAHQVIPQQWDRIGELSDYEVEDRRGEAQSVTEAMVDGSVVWYWYEVNGRVSTDGLTTKINQLLALLQRSPAGGRVVVIETIAGTGIDEARERLTIVAAAIMGMEMTAPSADQN